MNLVKITETATTITLGWTPPTGIGGYVFYANGVAVSTGSPNLKDGTPRDSVKFSKTTPGPPFQVAAVCRQGEVILLEQATYSEAPPPGPRLWASDSPINTPIPAGVAVLLGYGQGPLNGLPGVGFNGGGWGVAVFRDTSGARRTVTNPDGWKLDNVPAPAQFDEYVNAMAALGDTERHAVIFDGDRAHNIYGGNPALTTAGALGELRAAGSGFWDNNVGPWLGRASGFCSAAGAVLKSELDAGVVDHALAVGWPKDRIGSAAVAPATTSDGSAGSGGIPMGSRLQLDPTLTDAQILALGISAYYLPVAKAMQKYGAYVCDSTDWMTIYAESWNDAGKVSWPAGFGGSSGATGLVPHLRVVAGAAAPVYDDRNVFGQPHQGTTPPSVIPKYVADFETGDFSQVLSLQQITAGRMSVVTSGALEGTRSALVRNEFSDYPVAAGQRTEMVTDDINSLIGVSGSMQGRETWCEWKEKLLPGFEISPAWCIIHQWHGGTGSPVFAIEANGPAPGTLNCVIRGGSANGNYRIHEIADPVPINTLLHFRAYRRWDTGAAGRTKVWLNGTLVVDDTGPNLYVGGESAAYQKCGIYRSHVTTPGVESQLLYDGIRWYDADPGWTNAPPVPPTGILIWNGDLDTGNESQYDTYIRNAPDRWRVTTADGAVTPRQGTHMARVECRQGEAASWGASLSATLALRNGLPYGFDKANKDGYLAWSAYIPSDYPWSDPGKHSDFMEWHGVGGMDQAPVHWGIIAQTGRFYIDLHRDVAGYNPVFQPQFEKLSDPGMANTWHDYVVRVLWSQGSDGRFQFWRDGDLKHDYTGPTAPKSGEGLKLQMGIYCRNGPPATKHIYLDEIKLGTTREIVTP